MLATDMAGRKPPNRLSRFSLWLWRREASAIQRILWIWRPRHHRHISAESSIRFLFYPQAVAGGAAKVVQSVCRKGSNAETFTAAKTRRSARGRPSTQRPVAAALVMVWRGGRRLLAWQSLQRLSRCGGCLGFVAKQEDRGCCLGEGA